MPTKHSRIPVTCDRELSAALDRVAAVVGDTLPRARLVHDLALRGASVVVREAAERKATLERLAELSSDPTGALFDREVLVRIDEDAWGYDPSGD